MDPVGDFLLQIGIESNPVISSKNWYAQIDEGKAPLPETTRRCNTGAPYRLKFSTDHEATLIPVDTLSGHRLIMSKALNQPFHRSLPSLGEDNNIIRIREM